MFNIITVFANFLEDKFLFMSYLDQITYCIIVIYFHLPKPICH